MKQPEHRNQSRRGAGRFESFIYTEKIILGTSKILLFAFRLHGALWGNSASSPKFPGSHLPNTPCSSVPPPNFFFADQSILCHGSSSRPYFFPPQAWGEYPGSPQNFRASTRGPSSPRAPLGCGTERGGMRAMASLGCGGEMRPVASSMCLTPPPSPRQGPTPRLCAATAGGITAVQTASKTLPTIPTHRK
jgi:hypothetical protein